MDNTFLVNAFCNVLFGASAGYITNDIAVKMLFRKIGPFGGIVVKERKIFSEKIGELVERDLLNHHTLGKEFSKIEFRDKFQNMIRDYFEQNLPQKIKNMSFAEISNFEESEESIKKRVMDYLNINMIKVIEKVEKNIESSEIISEKQIEEVSEKLIKYANETIRENRVIYNVIKKLYKENSDKKIEDIIGKEFLKKIAEGFREKNFNLHEILEKNSEEDIDIIFKTIYNNYKIGDTIEKIDAKIKEKSLSEFFGKESSEDISKHLINEFKEFSNTQDAKNIIAEIADLSMRTLKGTDKSLYEMFDEEVNEKIEKFIRRFCPEMIENLIKIINKNKAEIENIIDISINESIEKRGKIEGGALNLLKKYLYNKIIKENDGIGGILIKYIEDNKENNIHNLSKELTDELIKTLRNKTVSEIINKLENKGFISLKLIEELLDYNIKSYINSLDSGVLKDFLNNKIGDISDINLKEFFEKNIYTELVKVIKEKIIFTDKFSLTINDYIVDKILKINISELEEVIKKENINEISDCIENMVLKFEEEKTVDITNFLKEKITEKNKENSLRDIIGENTFEKISNDILQEVNKNIKEFSYKNNKIEKELEKITKQNNFIEKASDDLFKMVSSNLENILKGKISNGITENLDKLEDKEIQKIVEDFMGKELEPINKLGALLGGAVGAIMSPISVGNIPINMTANAFIGVITNIVAIEMIFKPYDAKKIFGIKFQGVISKQKNQFADSMGKFVGEELFSNESVINKFENNKKQISDMLKKTISDNEYELLKKMIINYSEILGKKIYNEIVAKIKENKKEITNQIIEKIKDISFSSIEIQKIENICNQEIFEFIKNNEYIENKIMELIKSDKTISDVIPEVLNSEIIKKIKEILEIKKEYFFNEFTDIEKIKNKVILMSEKFEEIKKRKVSEITSEKTRGIIENKIIEYINMQIDSPLLKNKMVEFIDEKIKEEINPERKINELFEGKAIKALNESSEVILKEIINIGNEKLKNSKSDIADGIKKEIRNKIKVLSVGADIYDVIKKICTGEDKSVYDVVDDTVSIIYDKMPIFLENRQKEINKVIQETIEKIGEEKLESLEIKTNTQVIEELIYKILKDEQIKKNGDRIVKIVLDKLSEREFGYFTRIAKIDSLEKLSNRFEKELIIIAEDLKIKKDFDNNNFFEFMSEKCYKIIKENILNKKINNYSEKLTLENIKDTAKKLNECIDNSKILKSEIKGYTLKCFERIANKSSKDIFEINILKSDIEKLIENIFEKNGVSEPVNKLIIELIEELSDEINIIIKTNTLENTLDVAIEPVVKSFSQNSREIMSEINFKQITENELKNMHAKEIHTLFDSFAKDYFNKLKFYGIFGGIFGIHNYIISSPIVIWYAVKKWIKK